MKTLSKLKIIITIVVLAFFITSCDNNDDPIVDNTITGIAKTSPNLSILVQALVNYC